MKNYNTAGEGGSPLPRLDTTASPTDFPYGKAKNDDPVGSGNGTGCTAELLTDPMQGFYALLVNAGIAPNEEFENVNNSDVLRALRNIFHAVGDIKMHFKATSPSVNWLVCDGSTFSQVTYPELYAFLGDTNVLPDFQGRSPIGYDSADFDYNVIGEKGGEKDHQLLYSEMPSHNHSVVYSSNQDSGGDLADRAQTASNITVDTDNAGGDEPHNNVQPYNTVLFLIKAK